MDTFDLWTKQNINDIIFNFNEKNYELLRNFIEWYDIESNYMYILSTRYFYSNECLKLLLSTVNAFIDVKNNDILEEEDVNQLENNEINIKDEVDIDVNELENNKEINITEEVIFNESEKKNDSDEYVINDDYYFTKEEDVEDSVGEDVGEDVEEDVGEDVEDDVKDNVEDDVVEDVGDDVEDYNNLIISKFSNNEIVLLLNILEEDTKKFSKHNYIIGKCKEEICFYNNFYLGFMTGMFIYCLLKFV
jgi:hypothetical protein